MNVDEAVELDDDDASETYVVDAADRPEIARFHGHSCRVLARHEECMEVALHGVFSAPEDSQPYFVYDTDSMMTTNVDQGGAVTLPSGALRPLRAPPAGNRAPALCLDVVCRDAAVLLLLLRATGFADELARHVLQFLLVRRVTEFRAAACSSARRRPAISAGKNDETPRDRTSRRSTRGDYDLGEATTPRVDTWWISKSFDPGQNAGWREWLAFDVSPDGRPRRVTCVGVRIPPMPFGPLSVREFTVEGAAPSGEFRESRAVYETLDRSDLQEFVLDPPLETTRVRVTARSTAVPTASNCGLFQVYFR